MGWFDDFLTDTARQASPGMHKAIYDAEERKRQLGQMREAIPIEVERQKALMPGELDKVNAGLASRNANALSLLMIGKEMDRRRAIEVEQLKQQRKGKGDNPFLSLLTSSVETPNPDYGVGEEAFGSSAVSPTRTEPGVNAYMRSRGLDPREHEVRPTVSKTGEESFTFPRKAQGPKPLAPHYLSKPDGSTWVVDTPGAEPRQIQPAIRTAQPLTSESTAASYAGVPEGQRPTPDQAQKMNEYLAGRTGERRGATIEAEAAHAPAAARYAAAKARAIKDVGLEYLPLEVRTRAQEALNVATDPKNIAAVAQKIAVDEQTRQGAKPLPEADKQSVALLNTTKWAMQQLKTEFSAEERERFVGILRNPALRASQFLNPDPRFAEFQAIMGRVKKSAFDDGGKQLTPFEFSVVAQYIPQGNEASWQDYEAKLAVAEAYTDMLIKARMTLARTPRANLPPGGVVPGGTAPTPAPQGAPSGGATHRLSGTKTNKPDGQYPLKDGTTITVKGGVVQ